jgi:NAD(P)-dependent dehydrogenase (short-subunit alcohol dehydrogenase family)
MDKLVLSGRAVVVTGAFGNLGSVVARAFCTLGSKVALVGHGQPPAELATEFAAPHCLIGDVDLSQMSSVAVAMETVRATLGGIDVLVNIAGGFRWQTLEQGDLEGWDAMYSMNLKTAVVATKAALPQILRSHHGRVINVGAAAATRAAAAGMGAYAASKAGVHKLTESLAEELKGRGITANAVLPGIIDTPRNRAEMPKADFSRWATPAAIADVIVFLASDQAAAVTGALIPVFGRGFV